MKPLADQYVVLNGSRVTTDTNGALTVNTSFPVTVTAALQGPWTKIIRFDGAAAALTYTIASAESIAIIWDDTNSLPAERSAFYHVNRVHAYLTQLDSLSPVLREQLPVLVNAAGACNAYYDGTKIGLYGSGNGCANTALCPGVIYHEYMHAHVDPIYLKYGATGLFGMHNEAMNEGIADAGACLFEDTPLVARGLRGPGWVERDLRVSVRYPESVSGEPHRDGLILAGAFWKLREQLPLETVRHLWSSSIYGLPDDLDIGVACNEWFLEVLLADDDDNDLGNGTPHFTAVANAFNANGIGTALFLASSVGHVPLADTPDTLRSYQTTFSLSAITTGAAPDSVMLCYALNGSPIINQVAAASLGGSQYTAGIPAQPAGTFVQYFFSAVDPVSGSKVTIPRDAPATSAYSFTVGMKTLHREDFEHLSFWNVGSQDDDATRGIWERAAPEPTWWDNTVLYQPGSDHTPGGTLCFVTGGGAGADVRTNGVDHGKTTLRTPVFNLRNIINPVVRYYKWYQNTTSNSPLERWVVQATSDGGTTWVDIENTSRATQGWESVNIPLARYITPSERVQLRFVASKLGPDALVEALVEAAVDDFEILGMGDSIIVSTAFLETVPGQVFAFSDSLFRVDTATGATTSVVPLNVPDLRAIAIHPRTGILYGINVAYPGTKVYALDPRSGATYLASSAGIPEPRAAVFINDTTFIATYNGLYRLVLSTGQVDLIRQFAGVSITAMAIDQRSRQIWVIASAGTPSDYFCQVDPKYGDVRVIGRVGVPGAVVSLAADRSGYLFALESPAAGPSRLITIDVNTGHGTPVLTFERSGLRGIAIDTRTTTGVRPTDDVQGVPERFGLSQNYPNPFNPATTIQYQSPIASHISLKIFDLLGREVAVLVNEERLAGTYRATWDASRFSSGVYFYTLRAGEYIQTRKMILTK
ncbi:MAG: C-terminal target protein [Bacteroidetes bacterium]|nr:C-terminal target protein [Bacteroidota bacterium]